ncbi:MAG TPA: class I SAM-dependent methyltransferase [Thermoanaerobaculia bacterium]|nr:class I SAM-dependent methyltransferase [Thermoanaerobaculia bacterium]
MIHHSWPELTAAFQTHVRQSLNAWVPPSNANYDAALDFALGRFDEGRQLAEFFAQRAKHGRVLDIGAGNGGASLGMANVQAFDVVAIDIVPNRELRALRAALDLPVSQLVGNGHHVPFADASFDIILCLDTIEHVPQPHLLGKEIMRILKPGGICMITTPPRLRYLLKRDPHFGIPALLAFPERFQRFIATSLLRRTDHYDVEHIFWSVDEITTLFPGEKDVEVLWNYNWPGPINRRERRWYKWRYHLWDRILVTRK